MQITDVVVVGGGPAGLATSRCLRDASIDHVVLERADVAHSWRHERWESLRTLTPNWMNGLPGMPYDGDEPDGYMTAVELAERLTRYGRLIDAPVRTGTTVVAVRPAHRGWLVETDQGPWRCRAVIIATGAASRPHVPSVATELPATIHQLTASVYRQPEDLGPGRVLVVGASASGVQIADELNRSGRHVTIAVGEHVRLPRTYRGRDIHWWMEAIGLSGEMWLQPTSIGRPPTEIEASSVDTVVWATGSRPSHHWLDAALLDRRGHIVHDGGVMAAAGMYVIGLPLLRRRSSTLLAGIGADGDFARVSLPSDDCDVLRDLLVADRARVAVKIGLAYGSSALAIGEALILGGQQETNHVVIDAYQHHFRNAGWEAIAAAGLGNRCALLAERSQLALPRLVGEGFVADAAFVDGSHVFYNVFVDLYFLRELIRPGGLIVLDDCQWPSIATAVHYYFEVNTGWRSQPIGPPTRLRAFRLPGPSRGPEL